MKTDTQQTLATRWQELQTANPKMRIRDAATQLGVSEAQLLATRCGNGVTRLQGPWDKLIAEFPKFGRVMCLTRNEAAVHERYGDFQKIDFFHGMGQVVGPDIDLRLFMNHWKHGFAVVDQTKEGERQSLQFFDAAGNAVHKVYLQKESNASVYADLVRGARAEDQSTEQAVEAPAAKAAPLPDAEIDVAAFRQAWLEMKDTHSFFMLLQKHRVVRNQAMRLAPEGYTRQLGLDQPRKMLERAAEAGQPIMVFIGNPGCLQIHTGPVKNIKMFGEDWLNILDDDFNMHLNQPLIDSVWFVRKPTVDGEVTSVELYDKAGENVVTFFGKRKPGEKEDPRWRELASSLEGKK